MYQSMPMNWNYASQFGNYYQPVLQPGVNYWNFNPWYMQSLSPYAWNVHAWGVNGNVSVNDFRSSVTIKDYGSNPFVIDIEDATKQNETFRTALWTGKHLQLTLMSIPIGEEIGLELHPETDQFLRIEQGQGFVQMGKEQDQLTFQREVSDDDVILVPAGYWHNLRNTGNQPLKLYSIYAPPEHPLGTVHKTKADEEKAEAE